MSLIDGRTHFWTCDEANGNLVDSEGSLDLTGYGSPTTVSGRNSGSAMYAKNKQINCEPGGVKDKYARVTVDETNGLVLDPSRDFSFAITFNDQTADIKPAGTSAWILASCGGLKYAEIETDEGITYISGSVFSWALEWKPAWTGGGKYLSWRIAKNEVGNIPYDFGPGGNQDYQIIISEQLQFTFGNWTMVVLTYNSETQVASMHVSTCDEEGLNLRHENVSSVVPFYYTEDDAPGSKIPDPYFSIGGLYDEWPDCSNYSVNKGYGADCYIDNVMSWDRVLSLGEIDEYFGCSEGGGSGTETVSEGCIDEDVIDEIEFELQERGGYGTGTLQAIVEWDKVNLLGNERIDIYLFGKIAYRGYIKIAQKELGESIRSTPTFYGLINILDDFQVKRKYAYSIAVDLTRVFTDIFNDYVLGIGRLIQANLNVVETGVTIKEFDARGQSVAQAFETLCNLAPNQVLWRHEVTEVGSDRLFFGPRPTTRKYTYVNGDNVEAFIYPQDTSEIVNRLIITGGQSDDNNTFPQPNLCPNGSFEETAPASHIAGSYLQNTGFEDGSTGWTFSGGATRRTVETDGSSFGGSRSGSAWVELDNPFETISQTVFVVPQKKYTLSVWARRESPTDIADYSAALIGLDSSNNVIVTTKLLDIDPGNTGLYFQTTIDLDLELYPTVVKLKCEVQATSGTNTADGILVDDISVYRYSAAGQPSWLVTCAGNATLAKLEWEDSNVEPYHGGNYVSIQADNISVGSDYVELYIRKESRLSVNPNEMYSLVFTWRTADLVTDGQITIGARMYDTDGNLVDTQTRTSPAIALDWSIFSMFLYTTGSTVSVELFLQSLTEANIYVDAVFFCQGEWPQELNDLTSPTYWPGATYERTIDVEDDLLTGLLDGDAGTSLEDWGVHELPINQPLVRDKETAQSFAASYFNAHATPKIQARMTVKGPQEIVKPDGLVKLVGMAIDDEPPLLFPTKIRYVIGGNTGITMDVDLGNDRPDEALLLRLVNANLI